MDNDTRADDRATPDTADARADTMRLVARLVAGVTSLRVIGAVVREHRIAADVLAIVFGKISDAAASRTLTKQQVIEAVQSGEIKSKCFDGRDFIRLSAFYEPEHWSAFGVTAAYSADLSGWKPLEWTELELCKQVRDDASFGLDKAENERGISSAMMVGVLTTWSKIMCDPVLDGQDVSGYGALFFRDALEKYEQRVAILSAQKDTLPAAEVRDV